jgi:hypothetical protein
MKAATQGRSRHSTSSSRRHRRQGGQSEFTGIHQRRNKRIPLVNPRISPTDILEQNALCSDSVCSDSACSDSAGPAAKIDDKQQWSEAVMLWLSWNQTYEKATARMCKANSEKKLEAMFKEMELLRTQAIELSQGLLDCAD